MAAFDSIQQRNLFATAKKCSVCREEKPLAEFGPDNRKRLKVSSRCRLCNAKASREYRQKHPEKRKGIHLKNRYGISKKDYNSILAEQQGVCAICRQPERASNYRCVGVCQMAVDHDHVTDKVRGILCKACNNGLGMFKDNPDLLRAAAAYLESHQTDSGSKPT